MKYETLADFVSAHQSGEFDGIVMVDNDQVFAAQADEIVFDFNSCGPESALIAVLRHFGFEAERV